MPCLQAAPEFLEENKYANPSDMLNSPFQKAFKTNLPRFAWMRNQPDLSANFGVWMTAQHDRQMTWLDVLDFREIAKDTTAERTVFVDIGGGIGHQCVLLKSRIPDLVGNVVLQDSESVIKQAMPALGVDKMPFDLWEKQPIHGRVLHKLAERYWMLNQTGARAYYMRYVMHDYPDEKCRRILRNTTSAMGPDSIILIDDVIIPNKGAHPYSTDKDIAMMVNFAAMERTQPQWQSLFSSAGLKILKSATYNAASGESIQIVASDDQAKGPRNL